MTTPSIIQSISLPRLSSYKEIFGCTDDAGCFPYYLWNQRLSSELYILFSTIEICLRNRIHTVLSEEVSSKVIHETVSNFAWYDYLDFNKKNKHGTDILNEFGGKLHRITYDKTQKQYLTLSPQVVISQLSFGNWNYLISRQKKYKCGGSINWEKLLPLIFPNSKKTAEAIKRTQSVKDWRNRIAHLEPAWKFGDIEIWKKGKSNNIPAPKNQKEVIYRLRREIRRASELLSWLCSDTHIHYIESESYQKLLFWASDDGIISFL